MYICIYNIIIDTIYIQYTCILYVSNSTAGFHNFNLRIFNLRVKSEQINCGCLFDTMSDFNVPRSAQKNTMKFRKSTVCCVVVVGFLRFHYLTGGNPEVGVGIIVGSSLSIYIYIYTHTYEASELHGVGARALAELREAGEAARRTAL